MLEGVAIRIGVGSGDCAYMLLLERVVTGFVESLTCIIVLIGRLTHYHLAILSIIMPLLAATGRFLVTDPNLIFLLLVRLRRPLAALLCLDRQSALQVLGKLKCRHVHGLQTLFLAGELVLLSGIQTRDH